MLRLACTYLKVENMEKSINFYKALLEIEPTFTNSNRWVMFNCGNNLALYNRYYDIDMINKNDDLDVHFNKAYLDFVQSEQSKSGNSFILNFGVEDLYKEYNRIKKLGIGEVSEIMYVNITMPYYFFMINDPDGNVIEIAGNYNPAGSA